MSKSLVAIALFAVGAFFDAAMSGAWAQSNRIALVVGNSSYQHTPVLPNAATDAVKIAESLKGLGFSVNLVMELPERGMREAVRAFGREAQAADMAVVYYAGHGIEANGENWLIPVTANLNRERDLEYEAVSLSSVLSAVQGARQLRLVVLDACRNNPLAERLAGAGPRTRSISRGLARIEPTGNVLVAYSAKHGTIAEDGAAGALSPFADAFLKHVPTPGLDIRILMGRIRDQVVRVTEGRQEPFTYGSVGGEAVMLVAPPPQAASTAQGAAAALSSDELAWLKASSANRLESYRTYLGQFPSGQYKSEALASVERLSGLQTRWQTLERSTNRVALEAFVIEVEDTEYSRLAKQRLIDVHLNEQRHWNAASEQQQLAQYQAFLASWPEGRHADEARERIRELTEIGQAWQSLAGSRDEAQLEAFVKKFGWTEYGSAATARLVSLRRETAAAGESTIRSLSADAMLKLIDGKDLVLLLSGSKLRFDSKAQPAYRTRLGKGFFRIQLKQPVHSDGGFTAERVVKGRRDRIEGLAAVVKSGVDGLGSMFLLQMHGAERSSADVDKADRLFSSLQIVEDYFGHVCIMTAWEPILSGKDPEKIVERCKVTG